jgi:hypothetical protein
LRHDKWQHKVTPGASKLFDFDGSLGADGGTRVASGAVGRIDYRQLILLHLEDGLGADVGTRTAARAILFIDDGYEHVSKPSSILQQ